MILKKSDIKAIGYLATFTIVTYFVSLIIVFHLIQINLASRLGILIFSFIMIYIIARIFYGDPFESKYGSSYFDGLIHVLALIGIITILSLSVISLYEGLRINVNEIYIKAKPGFVENWSIYLPLYGLIFWVTSGIIVAYFYHSVTFEAFRGRSRLIGMMAATILFTVNYNAPLISSYWNWWDIVVFGFIFAFSYSIKRNPLSLLSAYLLFEAPLWWCILAPFGENVFAIYFIGRAVISVFALGAFIIKTIKKGIRV